MSAVRAGWSFWLFESLTVVGELSVPCDGCTTAFWGIVHSVWAVQTESLIGCGDWKPWADWLQELTPAQGTEK